MSDNIRIQTTVSQESLVEAILDLDNSAIMDIIISLDEGVADWDFTSGLIEHFDRLSSAFEGENA